MKKSCIVKPVWIIALFLVAMACKQGKKQERDKYPYALKIDSDIAALLKPTNKVVVSAIPTIKAQRGTQLFSVEIPGRINYDSRNQTSIASRVGGRIERLLMKYNYQPIKKGDLIMEIYSPDLAAAQRDLLLISKGQDDGGMLANAKQRLLLLGMSSSQIEKVIKTGEVNYRVPVYSNATGYISEKNIAINQGTSMDASEYKPMLLREGQYINAGQSLFSIYRESDLIAEFSVRYELSSYIKRGIGVLVQMEGSEDVFKEHIGLIEPSFKDGEAFSLARIYLNNSKLHAGQLAKAHVPIMINEGWWLPKEAVWRSGIGSVIFKKEKDVFVPKSVKTGITINGNVQITEDISSWEIASKAYYLVDSESFIKPQNTKE